MNDNKFTVERMITMLEERDISSSFNEECDKFGIKEGDFIIDYGCGSGAYTKKVSELIGDSGKVYALLEPHLMHQSSNQSSDTFQV